MELIFLTLLLLFVLYCLSAVACLWLQLAGGIVWIFFSHSALWISILRCLSFFFFFLHGAVSQLSARTSLSLKNMSRGNRRQCPVSWLLLLQSLALFLPLFSYGGKQQMGPPTLSRYTANKSSIIPFHSTSNIYSSGKTKSTS